MNIPAPDQRVKVAIQKFEPKRSRLILNSKQFIADFVPPDYLVDGILQRGFMYSLTGRTGSGKTAIMLLIAALVALGRAFGSLEVQRGRVLYFAGENPDDIRMRWIAMAPHLGFDVDSVDVHFIPGTFKISEMAARITEEAKTVGPFSLVIIDTSAAYFEGDEENSNTQQGAHARRLRTLVDLPGKPCVLIGCHPTKNAGDDNLLPRGGGAFIAEVDGNLTATNDQASVDLHWQGKFRGPDFAPISFMLRSITHQDLVDSRARPIPTVMAAHLTDAAKEELTNIARGDENRLLAALATDGKASLADLARKLGWLMRHGDPNKMKVSRARQQLEKLKWITIERGHAVLTDKGRKALPDDVTGTGGY